MASDEQPRKIQARLMPAARSFGRLAGKLRSIDRGGRAISIDGGTTHEDCRHRRHRTHRDEAREQASREGPRGRVPPRPTPASTQSPAKDWPRRLRALGSSSTWRTRRRSRTRRPSSSSRRPAAISLPRRQPLAWGTISRLGRRRDRLPASGYLRAKMAQENLIKASEFRIRLFVPRNSSSSSAASPNPARTATSFGCRPALLQPDRIG